MVTDEQIIVATDVSNQAPDTQQMVPMLLQTEANCAAYARSAASGTSSRRATTCSSCTEQADSGT